MPIRGALSWGPVFNFFKGFRRTAGKKSLTCWKYSAKLILCRLERAGFSKRKGSCIFIQSQYRLMIQVSSSAAEHIRYLKQKDQVPLDLPLRISVSEGGCSGFSYKMDFDRGKTTKDKVFLSNGVRLVVEGKSLLYLMGMTLDFEGGLNGKGFVFSNPNAKETCGCGSSFGV